MKTYATFEQVEDMAPYMMRLDDELYICDGAIFEKTYDFVGDDK